MGILEIILLLAGTTVFVLSFLLPHKAEEGKEQVKEIAKDEIKSMVSTELEEIRRHVDDVVDEAIEYAVEKTERSLERLTNEKIMAVNEYSDTVLKDIHKNHEEALFLYDMLNSKHANLKDTVSKVNKTVKEAEETTKEVEEAVTNFQKLVPKEVAEVKHSETDIDNMSADSKAKPKRKAAPKEENKADSKAKLPNTDNAEIKLELKPDAGNMDISFMPESEMFGRNSNERILELHKQGKSTVAIAKELGLGVGEVKLVIDLHKNM